MERLVRAAVPAADRALALAVVAVGLVEAFIGDLGGSRWLLAATMALTGGALAWRKRAPLVVVGVNVAALTVWALLQVLSLVEMPTPNSIAFVAVWTISQYSVAAHEALPRALVGLALGLAMLPLSVAVDPARRSGT